MRVNLPVLGEICGSKCKQKKKKKKKKKKLVEMNFCIITNNGSDI